jgi:serine protease Do
MKKIILLTSAAALFISVLTLSIYHFWFNDTKSFKIDYVDATPSSKAVYTIGENGETIPLDFTRIANGVMDAVVHVKSTATTVRRGNGFQELPEPFRDFFRDQPLDNFFFRSPGNGGQPMPQVGTGSGVIINSDGYIVTNNHVIADADDVEVTLHDNRSYKATVVGTDPSTDLALLQIKEKNLPSIPLVNSDDVKVGEWVMAVGNPFNLTSTVTAGIVSAKGRNINILREQFAVESFIQTDAAINPGNSGGALVNLNGGLIGINTAIASNTGTYAGYGFAVPANIVSKVVEDLVKFGVVQRGVLGVLIRTVDSQLAREKELDLTNGVYVDSILANSAAGAAGIKPGDVILSVDDVLVHTSPKLQELIARHRPGDVVKLKVNRKGVEKSFDVKLNNRSGNTGIVKKEENEILNILGGEFETLDEKTAKKLDLSGGVRVKTIHAGKLRRNTQMQEGFIITKVDGKAIRKAEDLVDALKDKKGGVMLEGVYENLPGTQFYAFGM